MAFSAVYACHHRCLSLVQAILCLSCLTWFPVYVTYSGLPAFSCHATFTCHRAHWLYLPLPDTCHTWPPVLPGSYAIRLCLRAAPACLPRRYYCVTCLTVPLPPFTPHTASYAYHHHYLLHCLVIRVRHRSMRARTPLVFCLMSGQPYLLVIALALYSLAAAAAARRAATGVFGHYHLLCFVRRM